MKLLKFYSNVDFKNLIGDLVVLRTVCCLRIPIMALMTLFNKTAFK